MADENKSKMGIIIAIVAGILLPPLIIYSIMVGINQIVVDYVKGVVHAIGEAFVSANKWFNHLFRH